jgi:aquaporin Z
MRKYVTEFVGTFVLVVTVGCVTLQSPSPALGPLAVGAGLTAVVCAGAPVSGGHYNPAVSLAVFVRGGLAIGDLWAYCCAQLVGAVVGASTALYIVDPPHHSPLVLQGRAAASAAAAEFVFTFLLAFVMLTVAGRDVGVRGGHTSDPTGGSTYGPTYGVAAGATVVAGMVAVGTVSGGVFNPAVATAAVVMGLFTAGNLWIYVAACLAGGLVAGMAVNLLGTGDA